MAKYLIQARYSPLAMEGLKKDKATGRKAAVAAALRPLGGKVESFYFTVTEIDAIVIVDLPGNTAAAAIQVATAASGAVQLQVTPLMTLAEMDEALSLESQYRAPGAGR